MPLRSHYRLTADRLGSLPICLKRKKQSGRYSDVYYQLRTTADKRESKDFHISQIAFGNFFYPQNVRRHC